VSDIYEFIDAEYATREKAPAILQMCSWLKVSRSGFYEWRSRPESATARRREYLGLLIRKAFDDSDGTYGHRRVWAQLARWGVRAGAELVRALMRELGLVACQPRPWRPATTQRGAAGPIPDLVNRDFSAEVPGQKMVGDITYIPTWEGWLYLATVIDCATRKVTGWAMDDHYRTPLITAAIEMAARNTELPPGAVFHSDRGSNYTSSEFAGVLERLGIRQSVGRTGICFDNALAQCHLVKLPGGAAGSSAASRARCSSAWVASWNTRCAAAFSPRGDRNAPGARDWVFPGSPQSPLASPPRAVEGEKAAWPETWRRMTRSARMKDILSGSRSAWSAASRIRWRIP
jgi:putative transposase